jgi:hypothetical protein
MFKILTLILIFLFSIHSQEKKKFHSYVLLFDDVELLDDSLNSFDPKRFCPVGTIYEQLSYKSVKKKQGTFYYDFIDCEGIKSYLDENLYSTIRNPNKEWLIRNKEKLIALYEFGKFFHGRYINPESTFPFIISSSQEYAMIKARVQVEGAAKGSDPINFYFDYKKLSESSCELSNQYVKLILTKEGKGFRLKILKDARCRFMKYQDTFWEPNTDPERRN